MHHLSIAAIVKNEGRYLREWIEFHRLMGVEHFYLYDNGSTDHTRILLHPYERAGLVTVTAWPGSCQQLLAYQHALLLAEYESEWVAFIDADEFLWSPMEGMTPAAVLRQPAFGVVPAVAVNWSVFGTGGHVERPDALVIESYVSRAPLADPVNLHVKSIVRPKRTWLQRPMDPHHFPYRDGYAVNEDGHVVAGPHADVWRGDRLRINHYWSKSRRDAEEKARVSRSDNGMFRDLNELTSEKYNLVVDTGITVHVPALCAALGRDCPPGTRA